jgi:hypothetical protein
MDLLPSSSPCRLAEAKLVAEGRAAALQELSSLFSRPPKQPFCISAVQIMGADAAELTAAGRKKKGGRARKAQQGERTPRGVQGRGRWGACGCSMLGSMLFVCPCPHSLDAQPWVACVSQLQGPCLVHPG